MFYFVFHIFSKLTIVVHIKYLDEWRAGEGLAQNRSMGSNLSKLA